MNQHIVSSPNPLCDEQHVLDGLKAGPGGVPSGKCLNILFEEQVGRTPDAIALVFENRSLSYAELNRRANRFAHYLSELGVGPEVLVAICAEPSVEMIVSLLAVLKAGGAYLPLDPAFPLERLRFMLEDSAPVALLTQAHLRANFSEIDRNLNILDISAANPPWSSYPESNPDTASIGLHSGSLAHVIYTSGSTGKPKGVLIEQRALTVLVEWFIGECNLTSQFVSLPATSFAFSAFYKNIYGPLFIGGQIHLVKNLKDSNAMLAAVSRANVPLLNVTPTAFSMLVDANSQGELSKVHTIMLVGEPIQIHKLSLLPDPRPEIINTYGQAESGLASFHRIGPLSDLSVGEITSVGRPHPYARIYILDEHLQPVQSGAEGELYIASEGMARGYLNRPELTAQRFLPDPFVPSSEARMFKSGDMGRWLPDGTIEFLGRNDFQVKIRGVRVELGEIEVRLSQYPGVREAVVLVRQDNPGDERLVAYHLASPADSGNQSPLHPGQLRAYMAAGLPEHMVPAAYVRLESWPTTPNGKLDRRALPPPNRDSYPSCDYEPPEGPMEAEIAAIWADVLKLDQVGRHDSFFLLGGNSLLAMQVEVRLRKAYGMEVPVSHIFQNPTIESFSQVVESLLHSMQADTDLLRILGELEAMPEISAEGAL